MPDSCWQWSILYDNIDDPSAERQRPRSLRHPKMTMQYSSSTLPESGLTSQVRGSELRLTLQNRFMRRQRRSVNCDARRDHRTSTDNAVGATAKTVKTRGKLKEKSYRVFCLKAGLGGSSDRTDRGWFFPRSPPLSASGPIGRTAGRCISSCRPHIGGPTGRSALRFDTCARSRAQLDR